LICQLLSGEIGEERGVRCRLSGQESRFTTGEEELHDRPHLLLRVANDITTGTKSTTKERKHWQIQGAFTISGRFGFEIGRQRISFPTPLAFNHYTISQRLLAAIRAERGHEKRD
jgi:hypothetical protein